MKLNIHPHAWMYWGRKDVYRGCDTPHEVYRVSIPALEGVENFAPGGAMDMNQQLGLVRLKDTGETEFVEFTDSWSQIYDTLKEPKFEGTKSLAERGYASSDDLMSDIQSQITPHLLKLCVKSDNLEVLRSVAQKASPEEVGPALVDACEKQGRSAINTLLPYCTETVFDAELEVLRIETKWENYAGTVAELLGFEEKVVPFDHFIDNTIGRNTYDHAKAFLSRQTLDASLPRAVPQQHGPSLSRSRRL